MRNTSRPPAARRDSSAACSWRAFRRPRNCADRQAQRGEGEHRTRRPGCRGRGGGLRLNGRGGRGSGAGDCDPGGRCFGGCFRCGSARLRRRGGPGGCGRRRHGRLGGRARWGHRRCRGGWNGRCLRDGGRRRRRGRRPWRRRLNGHSSRPRAYARGGRFSNNGRHRLVVRLAGQARQQPRRQHQADAGQHQDQRRMGDVELDAESFDRRRLVCWSCCR